jgi:uncharacterized membrane protein YoaK (UPF0700 family)
MAWLSVRRRSSRREVPTNASVHSSPLLMLVTASEVIQVTNTLVDAWRSIIGLPEEKYGPLPPLLLVMTVVTGLVDAFSYLDLGHVFVANMTGNVVFLAFAIGGAPGFSIGASLLALGAFAVGAMCGGRLIARLAVHRGRLLAVAAAIECCFVAAALIVSSLSGSVSGGASRFTLIALLAFTMGVQNATSRRLAVPDLTTTVLSMTITGVAADSRLGRGSGSKVGRRGLSILAMFAGALTGALLVVHGHRSIALAVALVALVVVTGVTAARSRSNPSWARSSA